MFSFWIPMRITLTLRLLLSVAFISILSIVYGIDLKESNELCMPQKSANLGKKLIFVSTLDGRLTALNAALGGVSWSISTGPGPLLSSSIHELELTNNGHWVRMIPSLSGSLYKFDGIGIETVPVSADTLLQSSSFRLTDGIVISGGRENRVYGIEPESGQILYECSMKGCDNNISYNGSDNILVIQRNTQTVRAVDIHTGSERWNFSVGQHDVKLRYTTSNCDKSGTDHPILDYKLKTILPEGIVCAIQNSQPEKILWKHKFSAPVVAIWEVKDGDLRPLDLFDGLELSSAYSDNIRPYSPALYIGMHNKQLYIQESVTVQHNVRKLSTHGAHANHLRIPWEPVSATGIAVGITDENDTASQEEDAPTTALSVLYASEYVNGNGYYLFSNTLSSGKKCTPSERTNITIEENENDYSDQSDELGSTPVETIAVSLWYWWKEVLVISFTTAILVNVIFTQRLLPLLQLEPQEGRQEIIVVEKPVPAEFQLAMEHCPSSRSNSDPAQQSSIDFTSRYLDDFECVQCLGRGGFGIVFEAINKIDECNYAIKRIALPNRKGSRDRVLREVKALAKLDHQHIVRYFNAWLECPPPGWVERHDAVYLSGDMQDATTISSTGMDGKSALNRHSRENNSSVSHAELPVRIVDKSWDQSDSLVVFEDSGQQDANKKTLPDKAEIYLLLEDVAESESGNIHCERDATSSSHMQCNSCDISQSKNGSIPAIGSSARMFLYIQMQLCQRESLREWLCENVTVREKHQIFDIFGQIVQAVEYIHLQGLIHRDLKPSNIFFALNGQIKVGDFGLVTAILNSGSEQSIPNQDHFVKNSERHTAQVGTQLYMSPEQIKGQPYDYKVDIYSLGLILFELLYPFSTQMERTNTLLNLRRNVFPADFEQNFRQEYRLLYSMLSPNPEKRPTTFGIRAQPPLSSNPNLNKEPRSEEWHFELPSRRRNSSKSSSSNCSLEICE